MSASNDPDHKAAAAPVSQPDDSTAPTPSAPEGDLDLVEPEPSSDWKSILRKPATLGALLVGLLIAGFVVYLELSEDAGLPIPEVSYSLLPNEGKTDGIPIAIKLNQVTVFVINDPMEGGAGASRAPQLVERLQNAVSDLKENPGKAITYVTEGPYPELVLQEMDYTQRRTLIAVTEGDVTLAGVSDPKRVVRVWAERLTDTLKVLGFGEAPEFTGGTEFGTALETMYALASAQEGAVSKGRLDDAYERLNDSQKLALETIPPLPEAPAALADPEMPIMPLEQ